MAKCQLSSSTLKHPRRSSNWRTRVKKSPGWAPEEDVDKNIILRPNTSHELASFGGKLSDTEKMLPVSKHKISNCVAIEGIQTIFSKKTQEAKIRRKNLSQTGYSESIALDTLSVSNTKNKQFSNHSEVEGSFYSNSANSASIIWLKELVPDTPIDKLTELRKSFPTDDISSHHSWSSDAGLEDSKSRSCEKGQTSTRTSENVKHYQESAPGSRFFLMQMQPEVEILPVQNQSGEVHRQRQIIHRDSSSGFVALKDVSEQEQLEEKVCSTSHRVAEEPEEHVSPGELASPYPFLFSKEHHNDFDDSEVEINCSFNLMPELLAVSNTFGKGGNFVGENKPDNVTVGSLGGRSSVFVKRSSFWKRVRRPKPYADSTMYRMATERGKTLKTLLAEDVYFGRKDVIVTLLWIATGWIFFGIFWSFLLIYDDLTPEHCNDSNLSRTMVDVSELRGRDKIFRWMQWFSQGCIIAPLYSAITLYNFTNLAKFKGKERRKKLLIIILVITTIAAPLAMYHSGEAEKLSTLLIVYSSYATMLNLVWLLLIRCLKLEWRVNVKWMPGLLACYILVFIMCRMSTVASASFIKKFLVYVPLLMTLIEYMFSGIIYYMFMEYQENEGGLTFSIAYMMSLMEFIRFLSFVGLCLDYINGAPLQNVLWNVTFNAVGEIYTHTYIYQKVRNEVQMRISGTRSYHFSGLHHFFSSIRSYLEYVAPFFFAIYRILARVFNCHIKLMGETYNFTYNPNKLNEEFYIILLIYFTFELVLEAICMAINKFSGYHRISAIGHFSWCKILLLIIYVGATATLMSSSTAFLAVLDDE